MANSPPINAEADEVLPMMTFTFDTRQTPAACAASLRALQTPYNGRSFRRPGTAYDVIIAQLDDNICAYEVAFRRRSSRAGGQGYGTMARVSGSIVFDPTKGQSCVTGKGQINTLTAVFLGIALLAAALGVLFFRLPSYAVLIMLGIVLVMALVSIRDLRHLVRTVRDRLS